MATAETVLTVCSDPRMDQKSKALESWMRSKDSCPVWGEGIGKVLPSDGRNSPVSYSTACPVRGEATRNQPPKCGKALVAYSPCIVERGFGLRVG